MGLAARFIGIITSPKDTFARVVASPKWFGMLALTALLMAFFAGLPFATEAGRLAAIDMADQQMKTVQKTFGLQMDLDKVHEQVVKTANQMPYRNGGFVLFFVPIVSVIIAGVFFAIFNAGLGGEASFKQVFAVVVHSGVISALALMFIGLVNFFRGAVDPPTNLGLLVPMLPEDSFVASFLGAIDIFRVWGIVVLSMGLAVLYRRRTQPIAVSLFALYAVIAVLYAFVKSRAGGA